MATENSNRTEHGWTGRQRQVLDLLAREHTNAEIADKLGLSLAGAKWHVSEVLSILGVPSREEAARYWRRERAVTRRLGATLGGIFGSILSTKTLAGGAGLAAIASGAIFVAGIHFDGTAEAPPEQAAAALPAADASPSGPWVPIGSVTLDGDTYELQGAPAGNGGLCIRTERPGSIGPRGCWAMPPKPHPSPSFSFTRPASFDGTTSLDADHVEVDLYDGTTLEVPLWPTPPGLPAHLKFFMFAVPRPELVGTLRSIRADGSVIEEVTLFDPPGAPPRIQITAPLSELVLVGSNRDDTSSGSLPFPDGGRPGAIADPAGGAYRFRVEHDGTRPLELNLWCQSGVVTLQWESGPDSAGNGVILANVPPNSAGCFFLVTGGDGTYRLSAISGP